LFKLWDCSVKRFKIMLYEALRTLNECAYEADFDLCRLDVDFILSRAGFTDC